MRSLPPYGRRRFRRLFAETLERRTLLATINVTEVIDDDPDTDNGQCSLREAISAANTNTAVDSCTAGDAGSLDTVVLAGMTYTLSIAGNADNENAMGDLDVKDTAGLLIEGNGATIDANNLDRVFHIRFGSGASLTVTGLTITGGNATPSGLGGGIFNGGTLTVTNTTISGNFAGASGGGIVNFGGGTLTVTNSTISGNSANRDGGGIYNSTGSTTTVTNSTISGNSANFGGGINNDTGGTTTVTNSTISGNSASQDGGGIYNRTNRVVVINSTITGNTADADIDTAGTGGGVWTFDDGATVTHLFNSILSGNVLGSGAANDIANKDIEAGSSNNLVGDAGSAGGLNSGIDGNLVGVDPLLGPLQNNGGPIETHALAPSSPAIDAGNNTNAVDPGGDHLPGGGDDTPLAFDQRGSGFNRIENGTADIGAFELGPVLIVRLPSGSNDVDVRRISNDEVEVFDNNNNARIAVVPLSESRRLNLQGSTGEPDRVTVNYPSGGFFSLPDGIHFNGGAGDGDELRVLGSGQFAELSSPTTLLADLSVDTFVGATHNIITSSGIETASVSGMDHSEVQGALVVGAGTLNLDSVHYTNLGGRTTLADGTINGNIALSPGDELTGNGTVSGEVYASAASRILTGGDLTLGNAASVVGFLSDGILLVNEHTVTMLDGDEAILGAFTGLGSEAIMANGTLIAANGILLQEGRTVRGRGTIDTTAEFHNDGHVFATADLEFLGLLTGIGDFPGPGTIIHTGNMSPGHSPAEIDYAGDVALAASNTLFMELGGLNAGSEFDKLTIAGAVSIDGILDVTRINNYLPQLGDRFEIISAAGGRSGTFNDVNFPPAPADTAWTVVYSANAVTVELVPNIAARHIFYNDSAFDGDSDDDAIAPEKSPLLPGGTATFENYVSDVDGVTGIMIDVVGLTGAPTIADFDFAAGNDNTPSGWSAAASATLTFRDGEGNSGSDRIVLTWSDGSIVSQWLEVTMNANAAINLPADILYVGSAPGESGDCRTDCQSVPHALVNGSDFTLVRDNAANPAGIANRFDFNRDDIVDGADMATTRDHATNVATALQLFAVPSPAPPELLLLEKDERKGRKMGQAREASASPPSLHAFINAPARPDNRFSQPTTSRRRATSVDHELDLILDNVLLETIAIEVACGSDASGKG